jgi:ribosomal RNA-processing protein 17
LREERKRELQNHVAAISNTGEPAEQDSEGSSSAGEEDVKSEGDRKSSPPEVDHEAEYVDEDRYTTVTVEAMDLSKDESNEAREELPEKLIRPDRTEAGAGKEVEDGNDKSKKQGKRIWTKKNPQDATTVKKKKKFRYENKAERKITRIKDGSRNRKQAKARRAL